jgi:hypothetical protein
VRRPLVPFATSVLVLHGGCVRVDGHVAATRSLGVTSGTGAATGALLAGAAKAAADDKALT